MRYEELTLSAVHMGRAWHYLPQVGKLLHLSIDPRPRTKKAWLSLVLNGSREVFRFRLSAYRCIELDVDLAEWANGELTLESHAAGTAEVDVTLSFQELPQG